MRVLAVAHMRMSDILVVGFDKLFESAARGIQFAAVPPSSRWVQRRQVIPPTECRACRRKIRELDSVEMRYTTLLRIVESPRLLFARV